MQYQTASRYHKTMLHLPYVPQPYPDEIFGSWLARISLHNGRGAWNPLLEESGFGRKPEMPLFDLIDHSDKLEKLLIALGTNYERAITEMTTLPYWLTFNAASSSDLKLPGTNSIPRLLSRYGKIVPTIRSLGVARTAGKALQPRFCPRCLERDRIVHGELYWHRTHQLPNVFYCPEHHCQLRTVCPLCNRSIVTISKRLIDLPRLKCFCGHDFRSAPSFEPLTDAYLRLVQISVRALNCTQHRWNYEQVRMHLRSLFDVRGNSAKGRYDSALSSAFHMTRHSDAFLHAEIPVHGTPRFNFFLRRTLCHAAAPECCALLVAFGIDFDLAAQGFQRAICGDKKISASPYTSLDELTVESARQEILLRVDSNPHRPPSAHKKLYWFLRLRDTRWLIKQFPKTIMSPIPTVEEDRNSIEQIICDPNIIVGKRHIKVMSTPAGIRAYLRDRKWLQEQQILLQKEQNMQTEALRQITFDKRASAIEIALRQFLREEGRPKRIVAGTLAAMVGLSGSQVFDIIRAHKHLRETIAAVNNDKPRRQLLWAARQLQAKGRPLTMSGIAIHAGLPTSTMNNTLIRNIIATLSLSKT